MIKLVNVTTLKQATDYADTLRLKSNRYPNELVFVAQLANSWVMAYDVYELINAAKINQLHEVVVHELPIAITRGV